MFERLSQPVGIERFYSIEEMFVHLLELGITVIITEDTDLHAIRFNFRKGSYAAVSVCSINEFLNTVSCTACLRHIFDDVIHQFEDLKVPDKED